MTQAFDKLSELSDSLPAEMREDFEDNVVSGAKALAAEMQAEVADRDAQIMAGLEEAKRGEFFELDDWKSKLESFKKRMRAKYPDIR